MSSALPEDLSLWTYDTIVAVVEQHEFEPGEFDYKGVLNPPGGSSEFLLSVQKTACSLANTMDGFILFGVRDPKEEVAQARDRIVGIPVGDSRKDFGEKMQGIQPEPHFEASPRPILLPTDAS